MNLIIQERKELLANRLRRITYCAALMSLNLISGQEPLSPLNNQEAIHFAKNEAYRMRWYMEQDSAIIEIAEVITRIDVQPNILLVITEVDLHQSPSKWIDSTIVQAKNFQPLYHSSYNQQRDVVFEYGECISGYYFDKKTGNKKEISERAKGSFYDSSFYNHLIRWLPLTEGYSKKISMYNYDPNSKSGVMTATIESVDVTSLELNGIKHKAWKVVSTDDMSDNAIVTISFIDVDERKLLKQQLQVGPRTIVLEIIE